MVVESNSYSHTRHVVKYEKKKKVIKGGALDKMIVLENHSYTPFLPILTKEDYFLKYIYYFFYVLLVTIFFDYHIKFVLWINIYVLHSVTSKNGLIMNLSELNKNIYNNRTSTTNNQSSNLN
jgi:hypothetical protein